MRFNVTVDAPSPLLNYDTQWLPIVSQDERLHDYQNSTGKTTDKDGASVTFEFTGTGVWAIGARRPNHGAYSSKFDNQDFVEGNGTATPAQFQQLLFGQSNLTNGAHTLTFVNEGAEGKSGGPFFDIDAINFEFDIGEGNFSQFTIDNRRSSFHYLPSSKAWQSQKSDENFRKKVSITSTPSASVQLSFSGAAVALYGPVGPGNGNYTCQVDGQGAVTYNAQYPQVESQQLLCFFQGLSSGNHTLTATNSPSGTQLSVDFATVWSVGNATASPRGKNLGSQITVKQGVIIGVSVMSVILMALFGIFAFMCFRRHRTSSRARYNRRPAPEYVIEEADNMRGNRPPNPIPSYPFSPPNPVPVPHARRSLESDTESEAVSTLPTPPFERQRPTPSMPAKWKENMPGLMVQVSSSRVVTVDQMKDGAPLPISNDRMNIRGRARDGGVRLVVTNGRRESTQSGATRNSMASVMPPDYVQAVEPVKMGVPPSSYVARRRA